MSRLRALTLPVLVIGMLTVGACASGESGDSGAAMSDEQGAAGRAIEPGPAAERDRAASGENLPPGGDPQGTPTPARAPVRDRAVIQTGSVTLQSDDVAKARFDLDKVLDAHRGQIADERTETDGDGEVRMSRLVVRVPAEDFDQVMTELATLGKLVSASRKAEDVTTQLIDTEVRIRAQEKSLQRVEALLAEARDLGDIVAIEAQLTRRQADLDALKATYAWLQDQTTMSTINVYLERAPEPGENGTEDKGNPFLSGLKAGWGALTALGSSAARVAGAVLPFAVLLALLAVPAWLVIRRVLRTPRREPGAQPSS